MKRSATTFVAAIVLAACASNVTAQQDLPPELWDRPRTAGAIIAQESLQRAAVRLLSQPQAQLVIHHAAGQEPTAQAEELKSWLGALAIDSRRVVLKGGLPGGAHIRIEVLE